MFKVLILVATLASAVALLWMVALPTLLTSWVRNRTGFDVAVESLMVNPLVGKIRARGLIVSNPPTFPQPEFLQVREFFVDAQMLSLFTARPILNRVTLDIGLVALVKRTDRRSNLDVFRGYLAEPESEHPAPGKRAPDGEGKAFLIRQLEVRFDHLTVADYSGRRPVVHDYPLKIDRSYQNVTDSRQLKLPATLDQVFALGGALGELLPEDVGRLLDEAVQTGSNFLKRGGRPDENAFNGVSDTLEESKKP